MAKSKFFNKMEPFNTSEERERKDKRAQNFDVQWNILLLHGLFSLNISNGLNLERR